MRARSVMLVVLALAALCVGGAACSAAHRASEVAPGVYDLTIRGELDACSPARATGAMGAVGVVVMPGQLDIAVPGATELDTIRVSLAREAGWHEEAQVELEGCAAATLERSWTVLQARDSSFAVAYRESWRGLSACGPAMRVIVPEAPAVDCVADLVLDYRIREACAARCEVGVTDTGLRCVCD